MVQLYGQATIGQSSLMILVALSKELIVLEDSMRLPGLHDILTPSAGNTYRPSNS